MFFRYTVPRLLIVAEIGYLPIDQAGADLLFQRISRCCEKGPVILASNQSIGSRGEVFGDRVIATAILDRVTARPCRESCWGRSWWRSSRKEA